MSYFSKFKLHFDTLLVKLSKINERLWQFLAMPVKTWTFHEPALSSNEEDKE